MIKVKVMDSQLVKVLPVDTPVVKVSVVSEVGQGGQILPYEGEYEVTPKVHNPVVLNTDGYRMTDDVTVERIPQHEVSNVSGGLTLIIGDDYITRSIRKRVSI